jgi:hypothetical protein
VARHDGVHVREKQRPLKVRRWFVDLGASQSIWQRIG